MAVISEIIRSEVGDKISFGDYISEEKRKIDDFEIAGNMYTVRTHNLITRLWKNEGLLLETVPGATMHNFDVGEHITKFSLEGYVNTQVTLELEPETEYKIIVDDMVVGSTLSNSSGKFSFAVDLDNQTKDIKIEKTLLK